MCMHLSVLVGGRVLFSGYRFKLEVFLPAEYPMKPPMIRFMTRIYHPNVDGVGRICVDILKDQWCVRAGVRACVRDCLVAYF